MKFKILLPSIVVLSALVAFSASADVLVVGPGQTYTTIQSAVDAANPYDTIIVLQGDYDEDVNIRPNKDGLTIVSTEVSSLGENTTVKAFSLLFPPTNGADYVTIAGFKIGPGGDDNGVCIESSGDYATFAHNHILNCDYDGIRIDGHGNLNNNVHHNLIECYVGDCVNRNAIELEGRGSGDHNVHHNFIGGYWRNGIRIGADNTLVHQNEIDVNVDYRVIRVSGVGNFVHHNIACGSVQITGGVNGAHETKLQHNDYFHLLDQSASTKLKKNNVIATCPLGD